MQTANCFISSFKLGVMECSILRFSSLELKNPTPNLEPQTTALHHPQLKAAYKTIYQQPKHNKIC